MACGGSYLDLCFAWGVATSTFYHPDGVLWPTIEAIDAAFDLGFPFNDMSRLEALSCGFDHHSSGILKGCVLAIDGIGIRTRQPFKSEVKKPKDYRFRKGGFAIIVLAGCDVDARFICASCDHSGSTSDIIAWGDSKLFQMLEINKQLPPDYFFIGDEAFTNTDQFLSPWPGKFFLISFFYDFIYCVTNDLFHLGRGLDRFKDSFNFWLSHSRQAVERAFGILTQRWGIYWRIFRFSFDRWPLIVTVTMKLHNLCIDRNVEPPLRRFHEDVREGDSWEVNDNARDDDVEFRGRATGTRRRDITQHLEHNGILRPLHASMNSRC
jgi:hypothetical protein